MNNDIFIGFFIGVGVVYLWGLIYHDILEEKNKRLKHLSIIKSVDKWKQYK